MILSFSKENIERRNFKEKILSGTKIHTIRKDKHNRWKVGMSIQFYAMNPRNGGKKFAEGKVRCIDKIDIDSKYNKILIYKNDSSFPYLKIEGPLLNAFAKNDGFNDWNEMKTFFPDYFSGKIIYWELKHD